MSFLTRTAPRFTRSIAFAPRAFSTSFAPQKSATEAVKDTVKTVDRAVADKLVDGIEIGRMSSFPFPFLPSRFSNSLCGPSEGWRKTYAEYDIESTLTGIPI